MFPIHILHVYFLGYKWGRISDIYMKRSCRYKHKSKQFIIVQLAVKVDSFCSR